MLVLDALMLMAADSITDGDLHVSSFGVALLVALVASAVSLVIEIGAGVDDDNEYSFRVIQRIARRQGAAESDRRARASSTSRSTASALPMLRRAMRDGNAPNMARWLAEDGHTLTGWETDLSSQTGASQAGILLGSNEDIPAFRWVEKETGRLMTCSAPDDCAEIERRHASGMGLLSDGGASRGNLLSGEADEVILTVSRINAEKRANPGYRAFFANGFNVTRVLVLFGWELILEWVAALRAIRRDVLPRGHRGGAYPFIRAGDVRRRPRPDRLRRADRHDGGPPRRLRDVLELRRGRPPLRPGAGRHARGAAQARRSSSAASRAPARYAPRPYEIVVLSDHGQTQGATFKQRNGYGLDDLVERSLAGGDVDGDRGRRRAAARWSATRSARPPAATPRRKRSRQKDVSGRTWSCSGSGNLGLVYLMDEPRRLTLEEIDERHPELIPALRAHPHVGWLLVRSAEHGRARDRRAAASATSPTGTSRATIRWRAFSPNAARHLLRTDGFAHVADIMVGSFYDPDLDEGCAFEELISFHGGMGGPQTEAFILHPRALPLPDEPLVGAAHVNEVLRGWRAHLQGAEVPKGSGTSGSVPEVPDPSGTAVSRSSG